MGGPEQKPVRILIVRRLIVLMVQIFNAMKRENEVKRRFGMAVRKARAQAGLSQEGLAAAAGLDRTYIGGVERGERNPSLVSLKKIADGLGLSMSELFADLSASGREDG